jgi:hypothetical protein
MMVGMRFATMDFPEPGGPVISNLWFPDFLASSPLG